MRTDDSADEANASTYFESASFYRTLFVATVLAIISNMVIRNWIWAGYWAVFLLLQIAVRMKFRGRQFAKWILGGILAVFFIVKIMNLFLRWATH